MPMTKCIIGNIVTADGQYSRMLVDDGYIVALDNERTAPDGSKIIELGSENMLLPPLADCHTHFFQTGLYLGALDLTDVPNKTALLSILRWTPLDKYRIDETVWCWGFDPADAMPSAEELQSIAPNVPIFLRRADGHSCSLSTAAQKMLPEKLRNESGIYTAEPQERIVKHFLQGLSDSELISAAERVSSFARNAGAFTVHTLVPFVRWAELLIRIVPKLPIDVEIFVETTDVNAVKSLGLHQIGGCLLLDGSLGSRTAALSEPYNDKPDENGLLYYSDAQLAEFFESALENDLAVAMHAIGDRAIEQFLRIAECVSSGETLFRWRIEHAELITREQIERASRLGLTLSVQPAFEARWGGINKLYAKRLGERWRTTNRFKSMLNAGILLLGGSDAYVTPIDPIGGICAAMNHPNEQQRLTLNEALAMFSKNPKIWANYGKTKEQITTAFAIGQKAVGIVVSDSFKYIAELRI